MSVPTTEPADIPAFPRDRQKDQLMAGQDGARRFRLVVW
jgi:hypothetical protein